MFLVGHEIEAVKLLKLCELVTEARDKLRSIREKNHRKSEEVLQIWETSLAEHRHKLGDDCKGDTCTSVRLAVKWMQCERKL